MIPLSIFIGSMTLALIIGMVLGAMLVFFQEDSHANRDRESEEAAALADTGWNDSPVQGIAGDCSDIRPARLVAEVSGGAE